MRLKHLGIGQDTVQSIGFWKLIISYQFDEESLQVHNILSHPLAKQIQESSRLLNWISFPHVYKESNAMANSFSKDGVIFRRSLSY